MALALVYVAFVGHYVHWRVVGRTLSPVEPSEAMQTLEHGLLNTGFVFFALAILSTLVLGRWFCGWACHVVALQDLCTWALKKAGIRAKPFRSRLLVFVPLLAALYMFVWPTVRRWWLGHPPPALVGQFLTDDFWATVPGVWMSVLTLVVCGFLCVATLGNKGFCTYACPYGGFLGLADRVAPGRIRVTDDCDGCGHCTAACSSNVRVHAEVRAYGMVVNPGCMKCTDCVSVCPKEALHFGFGRPALVKGRSRAERRPAFDYSWGEEIALVGLFAIGLYAFRGLYDAVPFLLSLGLSAICAFLLLTAARLVYVPSVQLRGVQLRLTGRMTGPGRAFGVVALLLAAFVAHSAFVQYQAHEGERLLAEAERLQAAGGEGADVAVTQAVRRSLEHLARVGHYGLVDTPKHQAQLGSAYLFLGQDDDARAHLHRALELAPTYAAARYKLGELLARGGDLQSGFDQVARALRDNPAMADARRDLVAAAHRIQCLPAAAEVLAEVVRRRPHDAEALLDHATILAEIGEVQRGVDLVRQVVADRPEMAEAYLRLALMLADQDDWAGAVQAGERGVALDPRSSRKRYVLARMAAQASRHDLALRQMEEARRLAPFDRDIVKAWAAEVVHAGQAAEAIAAARSAPPDDVAARYGLAFLFAATGQAEAASAAYQHVRAQRGDLLPP